MYDSSPIRVGCPAVPTAGATVTLFDSTVTFNKMGLHMSEIERIRFDFAGLNQPSATNGLIGYKSNDKGVTWYQDDFSFTGASAVLPATVPAASGAANASYDIFIGTSGDVKFTFTASGTAATLGWPPAISLIPSGFGPPA